MLPGQCDGQCFDANAADSITAPTYPLRKHPHSSHTDFQSQCGYEGQQIYEGIVDTEQLKHTIIQAMS